MMIHFILLIYSISILVMGVVFKVIIIPVILILLCLVYLLSATHLMSYYWKSQLKKLEEKLNIVFGKELLIP